MTRSSYHIASLNLWGTSRPASTGANLPISSSQEQFRKGNLATSLPSDDPSPPRIHPSIQPHVPRTSWLNEYSLILHEPHFVGFSRIHALFRILFRIFRDGRFAREVCDVTGKDWRRNEIGRCDVLCVPMTIYFL